jgi:hypothetical protein
VNSERELFLETLESITPCDPEAHILVVVECSGCRDQWAGAADTDALRATVGALRHVMVNRDGHQRIPS